MTANENRDARALLGVWLREVNADRHEAVHGETPAKRVRARQRLERDVPRLADALVDFWLGPASLDRKERPGMEGESGLNVYNGEETDLNEED